MKLYVTVTSPGSRSGYQMYKRGGLEGLFLMSVKKSKWVVLTVLLTLRGSTMTWPLPFNRNNFLR